MQRAVRTLLIATILASFTLIFAFAPVRAATFIVESTADTGGTPATCGVGDGCTLRQAINLANATGGADVIDATGISGTISRAGGGQMLIVGDTTINGPGSGNLMIDGNLNGRIFQIDGTATTVEINGLSMREGTDTFSGGCIYLGFGGFVTLTMDDVIIEDCVAFTGGGGLFIDEGSATITNSIIRDNLGGTVSEWGNGGGIHVTPNHADNALTITDSRITGNTANNGGGIFNENTSDLTISGSLISGNIAQNDDVTGPDIRVNGGNGGGIWNSGNFISITGSTVRDNHANGDLVTTADDGGNGGGIYSGENLAATDGGGIWGDFQLIDDTTFSRNTSFNDGGGLYVEASCNLAIVDSLFDDNYSDDDGGGMQAEDSCVDIEDTVFSNNEADDDGGGLAFINSGVGILRVDIIDNISGEDGGAIDITDSGVDITDSTLDRNTADDDGGGLYVEQGSLVTIDASSISNNEATNDDGGGIFVEESSLVEVLNGSLIDRNTAEDDGGGINSDDSTVLVDNSTVSNNTSVESGGGIYNRDGQLDVQNGSLIDGNTSNSDGGGGIFFDGDDPGEYTTVSYSTVSNNRVAGAGGDYGAGIYASEDGDADGVLTIEYSTISGNVNTISDGGGVATYGPTMVITHSAIINNVVSATDKGDAGVGVWYGPTTITNTTISGNRSPKSYYGAAGLGVYRATVDLYNVTITNNRGGYTGGISDWDETTSVLNIYNSIISGNSGSPTTDCYFPEGTLDFQGEPSILEETNSDCVTGNAGLVLNVDPMLAGLANNGGPTMTHALLLGSPAIDWATGANATTEDQRDVATINAIRDLGAYEYGLVPLVANFKCNGMDLVATVVSGTGAFAIASTSPNGGGSGGGFRTAPNSHTFTSLIYGTWTDLEITDGNDLTYYFPDKTCKAKNDTSAPVIASSDPAISKSGSPLNATVGETVIWTIQVWNPGNTAIDTIFVNDPIPAIFDITDVTTTHGSASINGQVVTVDIGTLQPGETATIQIITVANDLAADGQVCNTAYIGLIEAVGCINIFPGELPPTGGEPIANLWIAALGAMLALGLGGGVALRRKTT